MVAEPWYGVRCLFRLSGGGYEERITVWLADGFDRAIALAEEEAHEYAEAVEAEYLDFAQAFHIAADQLEAGTEVFSLIRESNLRPGEYLSAFFDTGTEFQQDSG